MVRNDAPSRIYPRQDGGYPPNDSELTAGLVTRR